MFDAHGDSIVCFQRSSTSIAGLLVFEAPKFEGKDLFTFSMNMLDDFAAVPYLFDECAKVSVTQVVYLFELLCL